MGMPVYYTIKKKLYFAKQFIIRVPFNNADIDVWSLIGDSIKLIFSQVDLRKLSTNVCVCSICCACDEKSLGKWKNCQQPYQSRNSPRSRIHSARTPFYLSSLLRSLFHSLVRLISSLLYSIPSFPRHRHRRRLCTAQKVRIEEVEFNSEASACISIVSPLPGSERWEWWRETSTQRFIPIRAVLCFYRAILAAARRVS